MPGEDSDMTAQTKSWDIPSTVMIARLASHLPRHHSIPREHYDGHNNCGGTQYVRAKYSAHRRDSTREKNKYG